MADGDGEELGESSHFGNRTLQNPGHVCTHLLSTSALQVCPSPHQPRGPAWSLKGPWSWAPPAAAVKPFTPPPILAVCLLAQSGSLPFLLFRFCLANTLEGHSQKMCCECLEWRSYPGQAFSPPVRVHRVCAWPKCHLGRLTRVFRCERSKAGLPCVWNATLPVTQSGRCLSSPKLPHAFGFSKSCGSLTPPGLFT